MGSLIFMLSARDSIPDHFCQEITTVFAAWDSAGEMGPTKLSAKDAFGQGVAESSKTVQEAKA